MATNNSAESPPLLDYTYPQLDMDAGIIFNVLYYGIAIPVSYVGNLFTYIIVCKMLQYRDSTADVLVGGLALNDVLTAIIVFTPALISAARGRYFGERVMCEFSAVTTVWYIYTTFAIIVLINAERWLAITKPFFYKRLGVTGFKLKAIITLEGLFCLLLASMPLLRYPVELKAGWYCAPVRLNHVTVSTTTISTPTVNNISSSFASYSNTTTNISTTTTVELAPVVETIYIKMVLLVAGIAMLIGSNISVAYQLQRRKFGDAASRELDRKFARIMGVVAALFLFTWLPNLVAQAACLEKSHVCKEFEFWAMRIVNIGVAVNPFVYGAMRTTYRRGYIYLARVTVHYLTCKLVPPPSYGEEIFDLRQRVRSESRLSAHSRNSNRRQSQSQSQHKDGNGNRSPDRDRTDVMINTDQKLQLTDNNDQSLYEDTESKVQKKGDSFLENARSTRHLENAPNGKSHLAHSPNGECFSSDMLPNSVQDPANEKCFSCETFPNTPHSPANDARFPSESLPGSLQNGRHRSSEKLPDARIFTKPGDNEKSVRDNRQKTLEKQ